MHIFIGPKQFLGRTATSNLQAVEFSTILQEATYENSNGVHVQKPTPTSSVFSLSANIFEVTPTSITLKQDTTITGSLHVDDATVINNNITQTGGTKLIANNQILASQVHTRNGIINAGTGPLSGGNIFGNNLELTGGITVAGVINNAGGNITLNGGNIDTGGGYIQTGNGNVYCNNLYAKGDVIGFYTSDARLKTNIVPISNAVSKLDNINAYTFTWDKTVTNHTFTREGDDVGFIAQEVQNVVPHAVTQREDGYYAVDYARTIPFLLACIKELKQEVEILRNEIRQASK